MLVRLIAKFKSSSSKPTIDDLEREQNKKSNRFKDVEDANFKEIPPDNSEESETK
jgi:hypothetical protein